MTSLDTPAGTTFEVRELSLWRGDLCLFTDLSFALEPGSLAVITGSNGSGKTSLLRVLAGLSVATSGAVLLNGEQIHRLVKRDLAPIMYTGHLNALQRNLTVADNLAFYQRLWNQSGTPATKGDNDRAVPEVLHALGLRTIADRLVRHLSAGQQRRAALARLQLCAATTWILDEPFTNLDEDGKQLVETWISEHLNEGGIAVVASHQIINGQLGKQLRVEL